ncbi:MAG: hypothetical protein GY754_34845 [bacterium]|nr:hypothetical protein [bacterium]
MSWEKAIKIDIREWRPSIVESSNKLNNKKTDSSKKFNDICLPNLGRRDPRSRFDRKYYQDEDENKDSGDNMTQKIKDKFVYIFRVVLKHKTTVTGGISLHSSEFRHLEVELFKELYYNEKGECHECVIDKYDINNVQDAIPKKGGGNIIVKKKKVDFDINVAKHSVATSPESGGVRGSSNIEKKNVTIEIPQFPERGKKNIRPFIKDGTSKNKNKDLVNHSGEIQLTIDEFDRVNQDYERKYTYFFCLSRYPLSPARLKQLNKRILNSFKREKDANGYAVSDGRIENILPKVTSFDVTRVQYISFGLQQEVRPIPEIADREAELDEFATSYGRSWIPYKVKKSGNKLKNVLEGKYNPKDTKEKNTRFRVVLTDSLAVADVYREDFLLCYNAFLLTMKEIEKGGKEAMAEKELRDLIYCVCNKNKKHWKYVVEKDPSDTSKLLKEELRKGYMETVFFKERINALIGYYIDILRTKDLIATVNDFVLGGKHYEEWHESIIFLLLMHIKTTERGNEYLQDAYKKMRDKYSYLRKLDKKLLTVRGPDGKLREETIKYYKYSQLSVKQLKKATKDDDIFGAVLLNFGRKGTHAFNAIVEIFSVPIMLVTIEEVTTTVSDTSSQLRGMATCNSVLYGRYNAMWENFTELEELQLGSRYFHRTGETTEPVTIYQQRVDKKTREWTKAVGENKAFAGVCVGLEVVNLCFTIFSAKHARDAADIASGIVDTAQGLVEASTVLAPEIAEKYAAKTISKGMGFVGTVLDGIVHGLKAFHNSQTGDDRAFALNMAGVAACLVIFAGLVIGGTVGGIFVVIGTIVYAVVNLLLGIWGEKDDIAVWLEHTIYGTDYKYIKENNLNPKCEHEAEDFEWVMTQGKGRNRRTGRYVWPLDAKGQVENFGEYVRLIKLDISDKVSREFRKILK